MKFVSYRAKNDTEDRVGLLHDPGTVTQVFDPRGHPVRSMHSLIHAWDDISSKLGQAQSEGPAQKLSEVKILPPLRGRDVLCVGKNYKEHAAEFHNSGYDSSDNKAQPDFPVIFTKRATSIIGPDDLIYPHPKVTSSLDYEGELGIIIGKSGSQISKENAWDYVWGATIINDVTARERQRDHKQFYIGKSLDTFCPMGPWAVRLSKEDFDDMTVETRVNGELRQNASVKDLIFDIPTLIEACSMGITLQEGDVIATGTPAGVALSSGKWLQSGDVVEVSITGLGTLRNTIDQADAPYPQVGCVVPARPDRDQADLASLLHVEVSGSNDADAPTLTFVHGLGGASTNFYPIIAASGVDKTHRIVQIDLPGHGLSPVAASQYTVEELAVSIGRILGDRGVTSTTLVGHSMGGLLCTTLASHSPKLVSRLILIGPVKAFNDTIRAALESRGSLVKQKGMSAIANQIATGGTSEKTNRARPLSKAFVLASTLSANPVGYAQACSALAKAQDPDYSVIEASTLIIGASEDKTAPEATIKSLAQSIPGAKLVNIQETGHWLLVEDPEQVASAVRRFIGLNGSY